MPKVLLRCFNLLAVQGREEGREGRRGEGETDEYGVQWHR